MIRAVLFDMDGVLLDSYEAWYGLINGAARDLGYPPVARDLYHASWGQGVDADVKTIFTRHTVAELEGYYVAHFREYAAQISVNAEAGAAFTTLASRGIPTAVVTNTPTPIAREILAAARLTPDALVGGTDTPRPKPAPDPVLLACRRLAVAPGAALLVGDSRFDREASLAAGVRFVGYRTEGDPRIESLREVAALVQRRGS